MFATVGVTLTVSTGYRFRTRRPRTPVFRVYALCTYPCTLYASTACYQPLTGCNLSVYVSYTLQLTA